MISFAYLQESHVTVYQNGVLLTQGASDDYTIVSTTTMRLNSGATAGDVIIIQRATSQSTRLVDYESASSLVEADLDNDSTQAFYMAQEAIDIANRSIIRDTDNQFTASSKRIKNVATPTAAADATTKAYVDAISTNAGNVPTPDNPGDDNYVLVASGGSFAWTQFAAETHLTTASEAQGDLLVRGAAAWGRLAGPSTNRHVLRGDGTNSPEWGTVDGRYIRMSSDAQGDVLYFNGTDYARLGPGTSGQFLKTQGAAANPTWADVKDANALGLLQIARTDAASLSSAGDTFTAPSGWVITAFEITLVGASCATAGKPLVQVGPSGGVETSGYVGVVGNAGSNSTWGGSGVECDQGTSAAAATSGTLRGSLHDASGAGWTFAGVFGETGTPRETTTGGHTDLEGALNKVAVVPSANTFDAGTVAITWYGYVA